MVDQFITVCLVLIFCGSGSHEQFLPDTKVDGTSLDQLLNAVWEVKNSLAISSKPILATPPLPQGIEIGFVLLCTSPLKIILLIL